MNIAMAGLCTVGTVLWAVYSTQAETRKGRVLCIAASFVCSVGIYAWLH